MHVDARTGLSVTEIERLEKIGIQVYRYFKTVDEMPEGFIYLAGPLFDTEELKDCVAIEELTGGMGLPFFSPRLHSSIDFSMLKDKPELKDAVASLILKVNEYAIKKSGLVLANLRGIEGHTSTRPDTGTIYEIGYASALNIPVVTYTYQEMTKLNLMVSQSTIRHFQLPNEIQDFMDLVDTLNKFSKFIQTSNVNDPSGYLRRKYRSISKMEVE